jgi:S1-C subfamily serine protease
MNMLKNLLIGAITIFASQMAYSSALTDKIRAATVKLTNIKETTGGSGVILRSGVTTSVILTNAHVCELFVDGGVVTTTANTKHLIHSLKISESHDLCLVKVRADLEVNTKVSKFPPAVGDEAYVSGHPTLLPQILQKGEFFDSLMIELLVDLRKCTKAETEQNPFMCILFGFPIIKTYEAQLVSTMVEGGSSGSGVFDTWGQVVGVVFAKRGSGYSPAFAVPYTYVRHFVTKEHKTLKWLTPEGLKKSKNASTEGRALSKDTTNEVLYPAFHMPGVNKLEMSVNCLLKADLLCQIK